MGKHCEDPTTTSVSHSQDDLSLNVELIFPSGPRESRQVSFPWSPSGEMSWSPSTIREKYLLKRCMKTSEHTHNSLGVALAEFLPAFHSSAEDTTSPFIPAPSSGEGEVSRGWNSFLQPKLAPVAGSCGTMEVTLWKSCGEQDPPAQLSDTLSYTTANLSGPAQSSEHLSSWETENQSQQPHLRPFKCLYSHTPVFFDTPVKNVCFPLHTAFQQFAISKNLYSIHSEHWEMTYAYFIFNRPLICLEIKCIVTKFNDAIYSLYSQQWIQSINISGQIYCANLVTH